VWVTQYKSTEPFKKPLSGLFTLLQAVEELEVLLVLWAWLLLLVQPLSFEPVAF
jgi:hypothetical protein